MTAAATPPALQQCLAELAVASDRDLAAEYEGLLRENPEALYREGGPVHVTSSCFITDATGEHIVLVWHAKGQFWVQPGGHLERSDAGCEAAARREAAEETGLVDLQLVGDGPALLHQHELPEAFGACRAHWDVQYLFRTAKPAHLTPLRTSEESPKVIWVRPGELPEGVVDDIPDTLRRLTPVLSPAGS